MVVENLEEGLVQELKDLLRAERQLVKALPKLAKRASSDALKAGFETHLEQTKCHIKRLELIFEMLDNSPSDEHDKAMEDLIEEGSDFYWSLNTKALEAMVKS